MRGDKLRETWNKIVTQFEAGERALDVTTYPYGSRFHQIEVVNPLYDALARASYLKLYSIDMGFPPEERYSLFSGLEKLAKAGIDIRSSAWEDLVGLRNTIAHGRPPSLSDERWIRLRSELSELREILLRLQPKFGPAS